MADKCETAIEVRTLSGELTTFNIPANKSIHDLKLLLKLTFPPASSYQNFHIFFKGAKLSPQSSVGEHAIASGEFMVLVPFTKKSRPATPNPEFSSNALNQNPLSDFAESAYSDMMNELSSLRGEANSGEGRTDHERENIFFGYKHKRETIKDNGEERLYEFVWSVYKSNNWNLVNDESCKTFVEVLKLENCLSFPYSGNCLFLREANWNCDRENPNDNIKLCFCPSWLKKIMEGFTFLNILSSFLQLQREEVSSICLIEGLKEIGKFGVQIGLDDIENLSVLCPKVVSFVENDTKFTNCRDTIVIISSSTEKGDGVRQKTGKKGNFSKILSAMKKREDIFKTNLRKAGLRLMDKNGNALSMPISMEDFFKFVKESGSSASRNATESAKSSISSASTSHSLQKRCHETNHLSPVEMVEHLREGFGSRGQMVHVEDIGARKATHVDIPIELSYNTKSVLRCIGITKLYSHQADSIVASLAGKNVVVATMTSSGKSLCYNLPVLEALCENPSSSALYLFPTKALAQDQLRALLTMTREFDVSINMGIYDGDTSQSERTRLRDEARLLITNPDMLHMSILPIHGKFSQILSNLRYVVIDEAHAYKGAFGCHAALILRRLRRICSHVYGSDPSFVFSTATSANPREHCMELASLSTLELIENDGSHSSRKLFSLWNPTLSLTSVSNETQIATDDVELTRKAFSPISEVSHLFAEMVQHGLRCIAFCRSRKLCELVLSYTREILQEAAPHLVDSICAYRAGYVAQDRRKIEKDLFSGKLCGIAATNALELGIDVGHIDVTLHLGFPGSIASLWQQAGRSGRREKTSLAVYVGFEGPLDQYFMRFPRKLFESPIECCHVDAQNQQVLQQHLVCAALEHPISLLYDEKYFGSGLGTAIMSLKKRGCLSTDLSVEISCRMWSYVGREKIPSRAISIRAIEAERYQVIDKKRDKVIEEIEESRAFFQVYEGAVYMHQGRTYLVENLDLSGKTALCKEADLKYYTKTRDYTDIHVIGGNIAYPARVSESVFTRTTAQANTCRVTTTWFGFHKIWKGSHQVFETVELSLPKYSYESQAVWIRVPQSIKTAVMEKNYSFRGGLHAASHAVLNVVPLYIRCNYSDLAPECPNSHDTRYFPERILLYDKQPGGTGISVQKSPAVARVGDRWDVCNCRTYPHIICREAVFRN
ncbi:uncharacterized ATP-dependent helicase YprA-like isoform X2 [Tripterygium wilfordii]|uniref:uncharacterized ATP-dependent helicase YprA-like isoform X2 n=1 Tax=Tripterygium wilfordii TaxID=458696 RepID=UPI0018F84BD7|nr:uncharacterized ATP-dependent helicase YprA-like isoform X2 [Tripterygium wilfordii]XP_038726155.1 uncharacterized ATP-dependent helicase YprA-like isoform X2 [Tripterygium wilfordii]